MQAPSWLSLALLHKTSLVEEGTVPFRSCLRVERDQDMERGRQGCSIPSASASGRLDSCPAAKMGSKELNGALLRFQGHQHTMHMWLWVSLRLSERLNSGKAEFGKGL